MEVKEDMAWKYYCGNKKEFDCNDVGKWMIFFKPGEEESISERCIEAVNNSIVFEAKRTNDLYLMKKQSGVACFYVGLEDLMTHKNLISFFLKNKMISRTKAGKYVNISFKLDSQTKNKEYGEEFQAKINLGDFIDLRTGEWTK